MVKCWESLMKTTILNQIGVDREGLKTIGLKHCAIWKPWCFLERVLLDADASSLPLLEWQSSNSSPSETWQDSWWEDSVFWMASHSNFSLKCFEATRRVFLRNLIEAFQANMLTNYLWALLKCRLWFGISGWGLRLVFSDKLPGDTNTAGLHFTNT